MNTRAVEWPVAIFGDASMDGGDGRIKNRSAPSSDLRFSALWFSGALLICE